ncbi:hypothetical protein PH30N_07851 [Cutibacterium modestum 30N]|nr:hypothetical protein [Cutibacterium modestum 30N]
MPDHPWASSDLTTGLRRTTRTSAMRRVYLEANRVVASNLLVVDGHQPDTLIRAVWDRKHWLPNLVVENPANGHAHAIWALREPVTRTEYARKNPTGLGRNCDIFESARAWAYREARRIRLRSRLHRPIHHQLDHHRIPPVGAIQHSHANHLHHHPIRTRTQRRQTQRNHPAPSS